MLFFSVVAALLVDALLATRARVFVSERARQFSSFVRASLDAGEPHNAAIAWALLVAPMSLAVGLVASGARELSPVSGWLVNVAVLYLALDFRSALRALNRLHAELGKSEPSAPPLARYRDAVPADKNEVARLQIEAAVLHAHRHGFGVLFWFALLGSAGAVLYWAAFALTEHWGEDRGAGGQTFSIFARRAFLVIDWLPARLTAATVAVVGNFEDAVFCWRTQSSAWPQEDEGVLLAASAGAMDLRLGELYHTSLGPQPRPELGTDQSVDADGVRSAEGLLWRCLLFCVGALLVLSVVGWLAV